ncbi:MAG: NAD-dependent epimerase/dehydratase family protein [Candidatus Omnitrophica bacterium]|nr:NAD-dependent epimerase/dehydratase family protein [Candidatus Omnitrophota bacterium]
MVIFITGATGFIGSHLAQRLASGGHKLRCLARPTSDTSSLKKINASIIIEDIDNKEAMKKALQGVDIVYHSAAVVGEWIPKDEANKINIEGTRILLEASLESNVKRFVHVSSLGVLGMRHHYNTPADAPLKEAGDTYVDTKVGSEKLVMDFSRKKGLPSVIVRPGFVFGAGDRRFLPRMLNLIREGKFFFLGKGNNIMNLVYIDNLIDVLIEAGKKDSAIGHSYNVTNKDKVTMRDFVFMICDILGVERPHKSIPFPVAKFLATVMETHSRLTKKKEPPVLTKARVKVAGLNLDFDISKTIEELNYDSRVSIREGLERTLQKVK